jgi:hypothetical protein
MHALRLQVKDAPQLAIKARSEYWIDSDTGQ